MFKVLNTFGVYVNTLDMNPLGSLSQHIPGHQKTKSCPVVKLKPSRLSNGS